MSGHSKWANIRVKKGAEDKKRSAIFTKMARNIRVAIKLGDNNTDVETNSYLRSAVEKAREVNMPKDNIERILSRFRDGRQVLENFYLEGFAGGGVAVVVEVETDSKIRTSNEVRLLLEKHDGSLASQNSVMFQFDRIGRIELSKIKDSDWEKLMDLGVWNIDENSVEVAFEDLANMVAKLEDVGFEVIESSPVLKAKTLMDVDSKNREKLRDLVSSLEDNEDVVAVFTNLSKNDQ